MSSNRKSRAAESTTVEKVEEEAEKAQAAVEMRKTLPHFQAASRATLNE
jgi:hypothetical protein